MGFDNECILNIQSLAGEYFCPVCRLLVYPDEALQSQCTHLYCKPCLTYVVGTTRACPYDGYLVTEADSKPLVESNKTLAETIGKVAVHCLYHRSGCTWQGQLTECITHCKGCAFGNSPVVCNRCSTQIVHRQVQEHALNCPGVQPQAEGNQNVTAATGATTSTENNQATTQATPSVAQTQAVQTAVVPSSGQDTTQASTTSQPQTAAQVVPTPEQWYQQQQQYQQYYQQYPGYDPYQQHYQQYGAYQQGYQQHPQQNPPQSTPGQQPQIYMQQPQPQLPIRPQATQAQPLAQTQVQPQSQLQAQPQQPHSQPQPAHQHTQAGFQPQVQTQVNVPNQIQPSHSYPQAQAYPQQPQSYSQPQPHQTQLQPQPQFQQRPRVPLQQQLNPQHPQPHQQTYPYPYPQPQSVAQTQLHPQPQAQLQARPQTLPHHPSQAVTSHQSYPQPQPNQQLPPGPPQLQSVHMHPQQQGAPTQLSQNAAQMQPHFSQQQMGQMRPPHSHVPMQQPAMLPHGQQPNVTSAPLHVHQHAHQQPIPQYPGVHPPHQQSLAQQSSHGQSLHPQTFPGQAPGLVQSTQQPAHFIPQQAIQAQVRFQAPSSALPGGVHAQQQSHQSQSYSGNAVLPNQGMPHQPFQPFTAGSSADAKTMYSGGNMPYPPNTQPQSSTEQQPGYVNMHVSSAKATMSDGQIEAASQSADAKEANDLKSDFEAQVMDGDNKSVDESESKDSHSKSDGKEISESLALKKDTSSSHDGLDEPVVKNMVREEVNGKPESPASGPAQNSEGIFYNGNKHDEKPQLEDKEVQDDVERNLSSQKTEIPYGNDEKVSVDAVGTQGKVVARDLYSRGQMQDIVYAQSSHVVSVSDNHQFQPNYGPSHTQVQLHQRLPQPDQLPPQNSHPQQMRIPGPPPPHLRPQGESLHGSVLLQGPPSSAPAHFQQPYGNQSIGSFHPENSPVSGLGPTPVGRGPAPFSSQGNPNVGPMPAHYAGDSTGGMPFGGPPPRSFDSQGQIMGRMPLQGMPMPDAEFIPSKRPDYFDARHPDLLPGTAERVPLGQSSVMQFESGFPARGPSSGLSNPSYPSNLQEERFKHFPEERYRQFPEGGFKLPGERHSNFPVESGRRDINQREFFEDLKRFPRPGHLDPMSNANSESYFSSSRPLDRAPHTFSSEARGNLDISGSSAASRFLPPYQAGGFLRDDNAGRRIGHGGVHPDFHLTTSESSRFHTDGFPRVRSPGREYSDVPRNRFGSIEDGDGHAFGERPKPFGVHPDSNPYSERRFPPLPSHLRRGEFDAPENSRIGDRVHLRGGDLVGPDILQSSGYLGPHNLHMGESGGYGTFPNPSRLGDVGGPLNRPMHSRTGFNGNIPRRGQSDGAFFIAGEAESLDNSRKRKYGSVGWCRICKEDCETLEGLETHSQSREHQKMAMDMVISIKKDNAKKQKVSSDEHILHEGDAHKSRKASVDNQVE